ncbi:MAG: hypothetical protein IPG20_10660 [Gammaproteobacteria bacterium]|nr:hypothetical protein [Gammaproteobacteria bacterium]
MLSAWRQCRAEYQFVIPPPFQHKSGAPLAHTGIARGREKHLLRNDFPCASGFRFGSDGGAYTCSIPAPQRDPAVVIGGMPSLIGKRRELAGTLGYRARAMTFRNIAQIEAHEHADIRPDQP